MEKINIPQALASAIHDYLLSLPMGEVEGLVMALRQALQNSRQPARPHAAEAVSPATTHVDA